jgi:hypothetical protein
MEFPSGKRKNDLSKIKINLDLIAPLHLDRLLVGRRLKQIKQELAHITSLCEWLMAYISSLWGKSM